MKLFKFVTRPEPDLKVEVSPGQNCELDVPKGGRSVGVVVIIRQNRRLLVKTVEWEDLP